MLKRYIIFFTLLFPVVLSAQPGKKIASLYTQSDVGVNLYVKNAAKINTEGFNFSPSYYQNGIVFVSQKTFGPIDPNTGERFLELFFSELDPNGEPLKPRNFSVELNSQLHEGPVTFNRHYNEIFMTRSNLKGGVPQPGKDGKVHLSIYKADKGEYDWENVERLFFNDDDYTCMHPTLSPDGRRLYFVSNKEGGYGGMDLYFIEKRGENSWSSPINLGPDVNTDGNEVFPFCHKSGWLFFSSDGPKGYGGLDLFVVDVSTNNWSKTINLGAPFNSNADDFGFIMNEEGDQGFFTSNRKKNNVGEDDIYLFNAVGGFKQMKPANIVGTSISVVDANSINDLNGATIRYYEMTSTGVENGGDVYNAKVLPKEPNSDEMKIYQELKRLEELKGPSINTNEEGEGMLPLEDNKDYMLIVSRPGYKTKKVLHSTRGNKKGEHLEILLEKSNCAVAKGTVFIQNSNAKIPNAKITIVNRCDGGSKEVTHTNIRGEFQSCLTIGCEFDVIIQKAGFKSTSTTINTSDASEEKAIEIAISLEPKNELAVKEPIKKGAVLVLNNIYYDFNKSHIQKGAAPDLESLAQLMLEYPSMKIELRAHTDCRGEESHNLQLSIQRAESAQQTLVNAGVAKNRIKTLGLGETDPINHCIDNVKCSEEEHQENRRTEVKIIEINEPIQVNKFGENNN